MRQIPIVIRITDADSKGKKQTLFFSQNSELNLFVCLFLLNVHRDQSLLGTKTGITIPGIMGLGA